MAFQEQVRRRACRTAPFGFLTLHSATPAVPTHDKLLQQVLCTPDYTESPIAAAKRAWEANEKVSTNGALVRSAALSPVEMLNTPAIVSNSKFMCMVRPASSYVYVVC